MSKLKKVVGGLIALGMLSSASLALAQADSTGRSVAPSTLERTTRGTISTGSSTPSVWGFLQQIKGRKFHSHGYSHRFGGYAVYVNGNGDGIDFFYELNGGGWKRHICYGSAWDGGCSGNASTGTAGMSIALTATSINYTWTEFAGGVEEYNNPHCYRLKQSQVTQDRVNYGSDMFTPPVILSQSGLNC